MDNKYYWNFKLHWKLEENCIEIGNDKFSGEIVKLFPEFYFLAQKGIEVDLLKDSFPEINKKIITRFCRDLINRGVLRNKINKPEDVFSNEDIYINNEYNEEYFFVKENVEKFKKEKKNRFNDKFLEKEEIKLIEDIDIPDFIVNRKSTRNFNVEKMVSFKKFSNLLSAFREIGEDGKFNYGSAGGLYPINIYLYVKKNRVSGVDEGLYFFNPIKNSLFLVNDACSISEDSQYFTNKDIFKESAFTIYLTYDGEVNIPKYGSNGYYYGVLDCGIVAALIGYITEYVGLGSCSIGDMKFEKIEKYFNLMDNEIYMHSVEVGCK